MDKKSIRPFGLRDKAGYLFGDFGNDFTFILSTSILMKFYTDVIGVSAAAVGAVMMLSRFLDAFTDVTMGRICDRARATREGKFRPWILRMCLPVAGASLLMYLPGLVPEQVQALPQWARIGYLAFSYILWGSFCYTAINIPYGSMASAVSPDPGDRQSLSTCRTMGGMLAGAVIGVGLPLFAYDRVITGEGIARDVINGRKVALIALAFSALSVVCYLLCYGLIRERVSYDAKTRQRSLPIGRMLRNSAKNRALISIIAASVVMLLAQLTMQSMSAYLFPDYYHFAGAQGIATLVMLLAMVLASVMAKPLALRFGKAEISAAANLFAAGVCLVTFFLRPGNVWVFVALQGLNWIGLGIFSMVSWALITDVIDSSQLAAGIREDGSVYALYSFARKLGQAAAAGVTGALLQAIGYNTQALEQGIGQTDRVREGIFNIATLVPGIGFALLAAILWFWYPLHKSQVEANVRALKKLEEKM